MNNQKSSDSNSTTQQENNKIISSELSLKDLQVLYTPDNYKCTLSFDLQNIAKNELRETAERRETTLAQLRNWIAETEYIKNCRLDSNFLLRFLRVKKFSLGEAFDTLVKYIHMRQQHPTWFHKTTITDPMVLDLINRGVAFALPSRDRYGRRVIFTIGGNIDPNYHTSESVMKALMLTFETLLENEENQIRGFSHILDESGVTLRHLVLWNPREISKIFTTCEKSMPMRHKKVDFIRLPAFLNYVYEFATRLFMSTKLKSRIQLHHNSTDMLSSLDRSILPKEYGGEIPMKDMIEMFKQEITSQNAHLRILALDKMSVDVELMKKTVSKIIGKDCVKEKDVLGLHGTYKSLRSE